MRSSAHRKAIRIKETRAKMDIRPGRRVLSVRTEDEIGPKLSRYCSAIVQDDRISGSVWTEQFVSSKSAESRKQMDWWHATSNGYNNHDSEWKLNSKLLLQEFKRRLEKNDEEKRRKDERLRVD